MKELFITTVLVLGITSFAATNIDDIFVLLAFLADPKFRTRRVIVGQYFGIAALILVSLAGALMSLVIPLVYIGFLGSVPIIIGCKRLFDLWRGPKQDAQELEGDFAGRRSQVLAVTGVAIANGGDNIVVYTPLFAVHSATETMVVVATFAIMTGVWCAIAHWLVHHRTIGAPIRKYGHRVMPLVLIGLGLLVMRKAGTFDILLDRQ
jgi:cadmium resistance protein CadD (predicted permease)